MTDSTASLDGRSGPQRSDDLWLVVSSANGLATMRLPSRDEVVFGRASSCDVVLDHSSVSREHASLDADGRLRDLGSRNGTVVSGKRLARSERAALALGCVAELGSVTIVLVRGRPSRSKQAATPARADTARDPTMAHLYGLLDLVGPSDLPVIILGETGVGKEVFAEAVHQRSRRARARFMRINCAGLTGSLLEAELFGHERGAFTGAVSARAGIFEGADGGTMFLDEVGELPMDTQAKLLRVLDSGEVSRLGGQTSRRVNVRYVSATNRDLESAVRNGTFRQDLFFRLNGFSVSIPPLRRRPSEILPLAELFLRRCAERSDGPLPRFDEEAVRALVGHDFPGNVRELKFLVERAFALANGGDVISLTHLALPAAPSERPRSRTTGLDRAKIEEALRRTSGNQGRAAALLGVSRRTLINRLELFAIERPRKK